MIILDWRYFCRRYLFDAYKRDTNLYNILVSKLSNENYNIENKNVKRVFDKWMKTFDKNGLDNIEYMKALKNATMCVNLLEPEDDEEEYFIKANKKKTPMGVYSLVSPAFFKFSNEDKEQLADKYDEFTNENFVPASSGAGMQIYWLDHIIRTACMIDLKMYLPIVKESTAQEIAEKIYNNCEKQKKNLYKICEEYKDYFQYLKNPENLDAGNPESVKTIQNGIRACRALIPGKMTTVDATIVKMLWLRRNDSENVTIDKIAKAIDDPELIQELYDATGYSSKKIRERKKIIADNGFSLDFSTVQVHEKFFSTLMRGLSMMTSLHKVEWTIKSGTPRSYDYLIELKEGNIDYWYIRYVDRITSDEERKKALTAIYGEFAKLKLDGKIKVSCATPSYEDYDYFVTIPPYQLNTNASIIHFDSELERFADETFLETALPLKENIPVKDFCNLTESLIL